LLRSWQLTLVVVYMAICYQKKTDSSLVEDVGDHLVHEANLGIYFVTHRLVKFCFCYEENQRPAFTHIGIEAS